MREVLGSPETGSVEATEGGRRLGPRTGCTNHCVACGGHFTSLSAFDAHRRGKPGRRYCDTEVAGEDGETLLVVKSENGSCDLARPPVGSGAVVFAMRGWWKAGQAFSGGAA